MVILYREPWSGNGEDITDDAYRRVIEHLWQTSGLHWSGDEKSLHRAVVAQWSEIFPTLDYGGSEVVICRSPRLRADLVGYDEHGNMTIIELKGPRYKGYVSAAWRQLLEYVRVSCAAEGILAVTWEDVHSPRCHGVQMLNLLRTALRAPDGRPYSDHWDEMVKKREEWLGKLRIQAKDSFNHYTYRNKDGPVWEQLEQSIVSRY